MKIFIASDHAGYDVKELIKNDLQNEYEIIDLGTTSNESVDYPNYAFNVGTNVVENPTSLGILICGTGIGMSIACNKVKGIRCAKVANASEASLTRLHNNANVIALSSKMDYQELIKCINVFLTTPFSNEERHIRRINKITEYENEH